MEDALANCPSMLVILSPASVNSINVMDEVSFALDERKTFIPVMHKDCAVPFRLRRVQYVDFRQDYPRGLRGLLKILVPEPEAGQDTSLVSDVHSERQTDVIGVDERERGGEDGGRKAVEAQRLVPEQARTDQESSPLEKQAQQASRNAEVQKAREQAVTSERPEAERKTREAVAEKLRLARQDAEKRQAAEKSEAERLAAEQAEAAQRAQGKVEPERQAHDRAETGQRAREEPEARVRTDAVWKSRGEEQRVQRKVEVKPRTQAKTVGAALSRAARPPGALWIALALCVLALPVWYFVHRPSPAAREGAGGAQRELLTLRGHNGPVVGVAWSPDGKRLATASGDKTAKVWDARDGKELLTLRSPDVGSVAWSPDGKRLATAGADETARIWDADTGKELLTLAGQSLPVAKPHEDELDRTVEVSIDAQGQIRINQDTVDISMLGARLEEIFKDRATREVFLTGDPMLTFADMAKVCHVAENAGVDKILLMRRSIDVAWSPDGKRLATGSSDNSASVWDAQTGKKLLTLRGDANAVRAVAWSPDGVSLATANREETVKVWEARTGKELNLPLHLKGPKLPAGPDLPPPPPSFASFVAWSPVGNRLAATGADEWAYVWDVQTGAGLGLLTSQRPSQTFDELLAEIVWGVAWSPDGKRLATVSADRTAKVWDAETAKALLILSGHSASVYAAAWSPDGKRLATGSDDRTAKVWEVESQPGP